MLPICWRITRQAAVRAHVAHYVGIVDCDGAAWVRCSGALMKNVCWPGALLIRTVTAGEGVMPGNVGVAGSVTLRR
ncbi:MAG TPA: hypothetical protein DG414_04785 [Gammaproteobacteria bacterium]|nr:hypothetical protein [Arenicellales bacterium]HCY13138.1 hypothetical protein [Gammaproteobacteria bacterium]